VTEVNEPSPDHLLDELHAPDLDLSPLQELREYAAMFVDTIREQIDARNEAVAACLARSELHEAIEALYVQVAAAVKEAAAACLARSELHETIQALYVQVAAAVAAAHGDGFGPLARARLRRERRRLLALVRLLQALMLGFVRTLMAAAMHPDRCCTYLLRLRELCLHCGNRAGPAEHCFLLTRQRPTCQGVAYALN
jgi:hypothetical protein